ncbi:MAG TPA: ATP-binding protein [Thermoanaerobaculia bacterium]|nr:ATP-binding protein [Thermoanaerobaculia bacterium]
MNTGLDESSYRSLFLLDSFPSAVIDMATDEIREVNQAFEELMSLTSAELRGRRFDEVMEQTMEWTRARGKDGPELEVESSEAAPWKLVRLRRAATQEHERRADKLSSMAVMAAGISHDFNNALMAALPWADLLRRKHQEDASIQTATEHIRNAIFRARDITSLLLDFAQPAKPKRARQDLVSLVREQSIRAPATSPGIAIHFHSPTEAILVDVDKGQIGKVVEHLLRNALEAIASTGTIHIRVSRLDPKKRTENGLPQDREFGVIEVSDDGKGMSPEMLEHAFDPFFTTKDVRSGTGLGLSIVFRIIEEHGGTVRAESQVGSGTTIRVFLPTLRIPERPVVSDPGALHILLVDDEVPIVEGIQASLELNGVHVTAAGSGEEALGLLRNGLRPDGIVLDLGLPGMRGNEVHALIRAIDATVPIIISSGWTSGAEAVDLLTDGRTRLLQKPYDPEEILVELKKF